jgi:5'-methylthioadenosine phosphorylase
MTQSPEVVLARELEMCYLNISLVTDYDVGIKGRNDIEPVSIQEIIKIFQKNTEKLKKLILEMIKEMPVQRKCSCGQALKDAVL